MAVAVAAAAVVPVAGAELEAAAAPADFVVVRHHARPLARRALAADRRWARGAHQDHPRNRDSARVVGWTVSCRC